MKKLAYILAAAVLVFSCAKEEINHPSEGQVVDASSFEPVITVDQETNQVTFSVDAKAVVPVWVFQASDESWSEYHTGNGYKKIFTKAGDYSVRMHVMNAAGMSPDYVQKTFHVNNTLVSFDKYYAIFAKGPWHIDGNTEAHMACGESVDNPTGWWKAPKNDKADFGVYDNQLTFTADGNYTFDPGTAGTVYVNIGVTAQPYVDAKGDATADYTAPASVQQTPYSFEVVGEDVCLVLEPSAYFPYIPNDDFVKDAHFIIKELSAKSITLVWYTPTGNGGGPIAWQFIITNQTGGDDNPSSGDQGGYTYGPNLLEGLDLNSTWFSAADWSGTLDPNAAFADGKLTLTVPDGIGGTEWQGQVKLVAPVPADPEKQYAFFANVEGSSDGTFTVKVADANADAEHAFFYDNNAKMKAYEKVAYKQEPIVPDGAYEAVMVIFDFGRIPAGTEITVTGISLKEITGETSGGQGGGDTSDYGDDILTGLYLKETWFSAAGWGGGLNPNAAFEGGKLTLTCPAEIGGSEWMGQVKLVAPIPADPAKQYAFFANVEGSSDGTFTVKVADANADAEHAFFYDNNAKMKAYEKVAYKQEPIVPDGAYEAVMVIFDFGRIPAGTEITVTGISLKEITGETSGGQGGGDTSDYGDDILTGLYLKETWFSAAGWGGGLNPNAAFEGGKLTLTCPAEIGGSEWMGQVKLVADVPADPAVEYKFSCKIESSTDGTCTVKVADANADAEHAFFYDNNVALAAYDVVTYTKSPVSPDGAYSAIMVIFDFGRMAGGTEITVTDIKLCAKK